MEHKFAAQKGNQKPDLHEDDDLMDDSEDRAFLKEGKDLSGNHSIRRPHAPRLNPEQDDFIFMQIDTDYYTNVPPAYIKSVNPMHEAPIIRMFGITANSNSVAIHVHNFTPYFYVKIA